MKIFKINVWMLLLVFIQFAGYTQSEKEMINSSNIIPLKTGENPSTPLDNEKLDFEKIIYIDFGQTAVIGTLTILYKDCIGEWSEDIEGFQTDAFNTYTILLSEEGEQKMVSFMSLNLTEKEPSIEWKNYKILILEDSEKTLKLMVLKNDSK